MVLGLSVMYHQVCHVLHNFICSVLTTTLWPAKLLRQTRTTEHFGRWQFEIIYTIAGQSS